MAEHGRAFTNAGGGGNDCCSGFITPSAVARPLTASTSAAIASGTVGVAVGAWNVSAPFVKSCSVTANAASAAAAVPLAAM